MVLEEEWAGHEAGVLAVLPVGARVVSLAADGSIRAWCSALPCAEEAAARCVSCGHTLENTPTPHSFQAQ